MLYTDIPRSPYERPNCYLNTLQITDSTVCIRSCGREIPCFTGPEGSLTRSLNHAFSQTNSVHFLGPSFLQTGCQTLPSLQIFRLKLCKHFSFPPCTLHVLSISCPFMQFSPTSVHYLSLRPKYSPQHSFFKHPQLRCSLD